MHSASHSHKSHLDTEIEDFRAKVREQAQLADKAQKRREEESVFGSRFGKWYFPDTRLLTKESLSLADLPDVPEALTSDGVNKRIEESVLHIMKHPQKYSRAHQNIKSIFGLFDEITHRIISKDSWKLIILEMVYGILIPMHYYLLIKIQTSMLVSQNMSMYLMWASLGLVIFGVIAWVKFLITKMEKKVQLLARQTLIHLVYNQLIICDVYFLQNADNNVIHKLLYSELDDFVDYPRNFLSLGTIVMVCICMWAFRLDNFSHSDFITVGTLGTLVILIGVMEYFKQIHYTRYMMANFEQRKNMYEFLKNFKSLTLRNLKKRFEGIANLLLGIKTKALYWIRFLDTMESFLVELCRAALILLVLSAANSEHEYTELVIQMASQVIFLYENIQPIQRFTQGIRRYVHYNSARRVLNRFFDSDLQRPLTTSTSSAHSMSSAMEDVPIGGVLLRNMSILDRDNKDTARVIHDLLSRKREKEFQSKNEELKRLQTLAAAFTRQPTHLSKAELGAGQSAHHRVVDLKGSLLSPNSDSNNLTSIIGLKLHGRLGQEPSSLPNQEVGIMGTSAVNTSSPVLLKLPPRSVSSPPINPFENKGTQPTSLQLAGSRQIVGTELQNHTDDIQKDKRSMLGNKYLDENQESRVNLRPSNNRSLQDLQWSNVSQPGSFKDLRSLLQPIPEQVAPATDSSRSLLRKPSIIDGLVRAFRRQQSSHELSAAYHLKLLITGLNLKVEPGSRLCVIDKGTHRLSKCLINCLIGESHNLDGGARIIRGRLSLYSPDRGVFLTGRSIKDNVIFGEDYHPERYSEVMRFLGLHLACYPGQDLYQVSEAGNNLRNEDQRLLLLARFLYRDAHIYLIEGHSGRCGKGFSFSQMKAIFHRLRSKTIIYTASTAEVARLSDQVLLFGRDGKSRCFPSARYMSSVARVSMNASFQDSNSQQQIDGIATLHPTRPLFGGSVANAVFMEHLQHTEELKIHHQRQERKQAIQKLLDKRTNVVDMIAYGIYLTNKRREEGMSLRDSPIMDLKGLLGVYGKGLILSTRSITIGLCFNILSTIVLVVGEAFIFYPVKLFGDSASDQLTLPLIIISAGSILRFLRMHFYLRLVAHATERMNTGVFVSILGTSIEHVMTQRSHRLLDKINKDLIAAELKFHNLYWKMLVKFMDILTATCVITYTYGGVGPVLILGSLIYLNYWAYKIFLPAYLKVWSLMSWTDYRQDDLNFQLLDLISAYRPINHLHKLTLSVKSLSDSMMKIKFSLSKLQKSIDKMIIPINIIGATLLMLLQIFGFAHMNTSGLVVRQKQGLAWASIMIFQILFSGLSLREHFTEIVDLSLNLYRILELKQKSKENRLDRLQINRDQITGYSPTRSIRIVHEMELRQKSPNAGINYEAPIVFKNVSFTQGQTPVLRKIHLQIDPGERLCILGMPGSGRSLIFQLMTGIVRRDKIEKSKLEVFGIPIEELSDDVIKDNFFLLEQNPVLIEGSVRENIDPYSQFSDQVIEDLLIELQVQTVAKRDISTSSHNIEVTSYFANRASLFYPSPDSSARPRPRLQSISPLQDLAEVYTPTRDKLFLAEPTTPVSVSPSFTGAAMAGQSPETPTRQRYSMIQGGMHTAPVGRMEFASESRKAKVVIQKMETFDEERKTSTAGKKQGFRTEENLNFSSRQAGNFLSKENGGFGGQPEILITRPEAAQQLDLGDGAQLGESQGSSKTIKKGGNSAQKAVFLIKSGGVSEVKKTFDFESLADRENRSRVNSERGSSIIVEGLGAEKAATGNSLKELRFAGAGENMDSVATPHGKRPTAEADRRQPQPFRPVHKRHSEEMSSIVDNPDRLSAINPSDLDQPDIKRTSGRFLQIPTGPVRDPLQFNEEPLPKIVWNPQIHIPFPNASNTTPEADAKKLLRLTAAFEGKNLDIYRRRFIVFCRAVLSAPRVLLVQEDALDFGKGVKWNLQRLVAKLPLSTIVCIVNTIPLISLFEKVALLDAGKILERGSKEQLLGQTNSFTYRFLKHINPDGLRHLIHRRNLNNSTMTHTILLEDESQEEESLDHDKVIEDQDQNPDEERREKKHENVVRLLPVEELEKGMSLSSRTLSPSGHAGSQIDEQLLPLPSLPAAPEELKSPLEDISKRVDIGSLHYQHMLLAKVAVRGVPTSKVSAGMGRTNKFKNKL